MSVGRTTRCCCLAGAISLFLFVSATAQKKIDIPLGLFPVRQLWTLPLDHLLTAPPALVGDRGYFPLDSDEVVAYELSTGRQLWIAPGRPVSLPASGQGLLYMAESSRLLALDTETGAVRWQVPFAEPLAAPLVWDNSWLIAATASGAVLAFRGIDGELIWRRDLDVAASRPAALAADRVYVPLANGRVIALQVESGDTVWERRLGGAPGELLALDDRLYLGATDNYFYGLRAETGVVDFRFRTGADIFGRPVADERRVYFVSFDNVLRALDRRTGVQHWKRALPLRPALGAMRAGDTLLVTGLSPSIKAFAMKDGTPAGEIAAGALLAAPPHAVTGAFLPQLVLVVKDLKQGTLVQSIVRSIDPAASGIGPLPNPIIPDGPTPPPTTPPAVR